MLRSKFSIFVSILLVGLSGFIVFAPKAKRSWRTPIDPNESLFHKILYISGPIEKIGNVFLLIPVFLVLIYIFPQLRLRYVALICIAISACIEVSQLWIPGRVSSLLDFIGNVSGVLIAMLLLSRFPKHLAVERKVN